MKNSTSLILVLLYAVVWPMTASAQKQVLTNEQVVILSVREAALKTMRDYELGRIHMNLADSGIERPISSGIAEALKSLGIDVFAGGISAELSGKLNYSILGFDFSYGKGASRGFLKKPMIKRELAARLRITIDKSIDGPILSFEDIVVDYADNIDPRFADLVKSRDIPELAPALPGSGWTKVAEPVVVTAVIGGIVYLFFANR